MLSSTSLLLTAIILIFTYLYQRRCLNYWRQRSIPHVKNALPFIGNVFSLLSLKKSLGEFYRDIYHEHSNLKYVGLYHFNNPALFVRDVGLIKRILVTDFSSFVNRPAPLSNPKSDVDFGLKVLTGTLWRGIRYKMTPAFSSGKLKLMYENMMPCSQNTIDYLDSMSNKCVDFKEVSSRFTLEVIGSCAFGIDVSKDKDANSEFRKMGTKIVGKIPLSVYFVQLIVLLVPKIAEKFGFMFTPGKVGDYFSSIIRGVFKVREESNMMRNDFVDFLLQIKKQGIITVHNKDPDDQYLDIENVPTSERFAITDPMLISQAFTFLSAGFDGLATPSVCVLHQLAKYKHYQQRVRDEMKAQVAKHGSLTYEALKNAKFLDYCINEGLRMFAPSPFIARVASRDYELEEGVWIEAGTDVIISGYGLQMDPSFHLDPHVFNPDRPSVQRSTIVNDFTNLPFGAGPRICIGMRMAQLVIKLFLASVILNYDVSLSQNCPDEIVFKKASVALSLSEPLYFDVEKL